MRREYRRFIPVLTIFFVVVSVVCSYAAASAAKKQEVVAVGIIKKQGITSYMYGTHVLIDAKGHTLYALKSGIDLDKYENKKVTIKGDLIKGYPADNGPGYLNVRSVEPPQKKFERAHSGAISE